MEIGDLKLEIFIPNRNYHYEGATPLGVIRENPQISNMNFEPL